MCLLINIPSSFGFRSFIPFGSAITSIHPQISAFGLFELLFKKKSLKIPKG